MAVFPQIRGVPRQIKIGSKEETTVAKRDVPHVGRAEDPLPWRGRARRIGRPNGSIRVQAADFTKLRDVHALVLFRKIPIEEGKSDGPDHAQRSENVKDRPPAESQHNTPRDQRRYGHCESAEEMRGSLNAPAFRSWKPKLHAPASHRESASFAQAEKKARAEERVEPEGRARHGRRERPPRHNHRQNLAWPEAIAQPSGRY